MKNKAILYSGLILLTISLLIFIGELSYIFAPFFSQESGGIGAIGGSLLSLIYGFLPIIGMIVGSILAIIGFAKSRNNNKLR